MAENKIIDLERLKDYSVKLKEHFIAEEIKVKDESKRYDAEEVESALKEISERTGYITNTTLERTVATNSATATYGYGDFESFEIIEGETYTLNVNGTDYSATAWMDNGDLILGSSAIGDWSTFPIRLYSGGTLYGSPNTTYNVKITGKFPTYEDERLTHPYIRKGQNDQSVRLDYAQEASGWCALAAGPGTVAKGDTDIAMGYGAKTSGYGYSVAIGDGATAEAEDGDALAIGGCDNKATNYGATVIGGQENVASGECSFASGWKTKSIGFGTHTEGNYTIAGNTAIGRTFDGSHAEGNYTSATGIASHAEGDSTKAFGAEVSPVDVVAAHAEGSYTEARGRYSHTEGALTVATARAQHVQGEANVIDTDKKFADIIGRGTYHVATVSGRQGIVADERRNISATTWTGDQILHGDVYVKADYNSENGIRLSTPDVLAAYFDATAAYTAGSYVTNKDDGCLYKAKADITAGAWDASKWDKITVAQAIATGSAASDEVSEINLDGRALEVIDEGEFYAASTTVEDALQALPGITCAAFDKTKVYNVGDFVIKDGALYKANAAHAAGEVFIPTKWDKTTIVENFGSGEYATKEDVDNAFDDIFGL